MSVDEYFWQITDIFKIRGFSSLAGEGRSGFFLFSYNLS